MLCFACIHTQYIEVTLRVFMSHKISPVHLLDDCYSWILVYGLVVLKVNHDAIG